jgi:hypothetical protein
MFASLQWIKFAQFDPLSGLELPRKKTDDWPTGYGRKNTRYTGVADDSPPDNRGAAFPRYLLPLRPRLPLIIGTPHVIGSRTRGRFSGTRRFPPVSAQWHGYDGVSRIGSTGTSGWTDKQQLEHRAERGRPLIFESIGNSRLRYAARATRPRDGLRLSMVGMFKRVRT